MICSQDDDLDRRLEEYAKYLAISGWKYKTAKERLVEGAKTNRKKKEKKTSTTAKEEKRKENRMGEHVLSQSAFQNSHHQQECPSPLSQHSQKRYLPTKNNYLS